MFRHCLGAVLQYPEIWAENSKISNKIGDLFGPGSVE